MLELPRTSSMSGNNFLRSGLCCGRFRVTLWVFPVLAYCLQETNQLAQVLYRVGPSVWLSGQIVAWGEMLLRDSVLNWNDC